MDVNIDFRRLPKTEKMKYYASIKKPLLDKRAIFADGTGDYVSPPHPNENDEVKLRLRTGRHNVDEVNIVYNGDERISMYKASSDTLFDYYEGVMPANAKRHTYCFEIKSGGIRCFYNKRGLCKDIVDYYNFVITTDFTTPDWAKGAVFYQIFVERFCKGDDTNNVEDREYVYIGNGTVQVKDWNKLPAATGTHEFYGGDLQGVMNKLDYLKDLGIDAIYFNPIFVSPSYHKYDIQDYDYVDPHFGVVKHQEGNLLEEWDYNNQNATRFKSKVTNKVNLEASNQLFAQLVEEAHKRDIKVILDGVFNHCGSFNKWLDREKIYKDEEGYEAGAFVDKDSPYNSFFKFHDANAWPDNTTYDGWWGHDTLPKLNYEDSEKLLEYIMAIAKKWLQPPYNVDGWRLDVAADLGHSNEYNHHFWKEFRKAVKEVKPDALILAEHYGDPGAWLEGDEWDTVMNYDAFMEPITWFLTGMEKHSDEFRGDLLGNEKAFFGAMNHHMSRYQTPSLQVAMNELSNHDHSRFLTRTNRKVGRTHTLGAEIADEGVNKAVLREAIVMQMTWVGAPTIYYGDEAGLCGWTDPDCRRTYPWGHADEQLIAFHKAIIGVHKKSEVFKTGSIRFLYGEYSVIVYGRFQGDEQFVILLNNAHEAKQLHISVWELGILSGHRLQQIMLTDEKGYSEEPVYYEVNNGKIKITLERTSAVILQNIKNKEYEYSVSG